MDQQEFERLLSKLPPVQGREPAPEQQPQATPFDPPALKTLANQFGYDIALPETAPVPTPVGERRPDGTAFDQPPAAEPALGDASGLDAIAGGGLKSVFETKDFLFGDTAPEDRSEFRRNVEDTVDVRKEQSLVDGFSAGIAQFAVGMLGAGKIKWAAGAASPWLKAGMAALPKTVEVGKAALTGAVAFDPHEERLSNLVQSTPLANPLNEWLAADPEDSAAEGRVKAALESIGLDAAIMGILLYAGKAWKAVRSGNQVEAERLATEFQKEIDAAAQEDVANALREQQAAVEPRTEAPASDAPVAQPELQASPTAAPESAAGPSRDFLRVATEEQPSVTSTPTAAAAKAGTELTTARPVVPFEDTSAVLDGLKADADAITKHGGWYEAIQAGHTFGRGEGVPWVKLNADRDMDDFMARVVDAAEEKLDAVKGGKVLSDKRVQQLVDQRVALFNEDPALLLGLIQQAGKNATHAVAEMEAGYLVAQRMFQDTYALANRIRMGDYVQQGSREAAIGELQKRLSFAVSAYGSARSITAASGRAVRRMRGEFKLDPEVVSRLKQLDGDQLTELLVSTGGNPRNLAKLANPNLLTRATDFGQFLLINNLVSGPKTQLINAMTNAYMVGARPLERMIGGAFQGNSAIVAESARQYAYTASALVDGFSLARRAFLLNDSVLAPHRSELWRGAQSGAPNAATAYAPWDSIKNVLGNGLRVAIGLPTRTLGTVDELVKQTVYRSKVLARAHVEGAALGLDKARLRAYVRDNLDKAFDSEGRGVEPEALREANIATFQQELLPNTLGKTVQTAVSNHPALRLVLPFVKTPTNVLRYGWKLSPGLNMLQREYRDMWTGRLGKEAQAQAYGQMSLGTLFVGSAAVIAANGGITGGGPSDRKAAAELKATGWQPYSFVRENEDGTKTYVPFNRFDPVAMPFAIVADLQDAMAALGEDGGSGASEGDVEGSGIGAAIGALSLAVARQFRDKTSLVGLGAALDVFLEPEPNIERYAGQFASNMVPYSAALRQFNADPFMRDAIDIADRVRATIPGLSEKVPARYDAWGERMLVRKGLWTSEEDSIVDREVQRMALLSGSVIRPASPRMEGGVDLRDITMEDGRNAFEVYQQLSSKPSPKALSLKERVAKLMASEAYQAAPDGMAETKGTKLWMLSGIVSKYREVAKARLKHDKVVRAAIMAETLRVRSEWALRKPKAQPDKPSLGRVGKGFGVDLDALLGPVPSKQPNGGQPQ